MRKRDAAVERASLYEHFDRSPQAHYSRFDLNVLAVQLGSIRNVALFSILIRRIYYYGV